jgi:hypothetical protein
MKGRIIVEDSESFVTGIRYGLNSDSMKELTFSPAARIEEDFELEPSEGYPKLEQGEKTTEGTGKLTVVAVNGAGLPTPPTIVDIKFIRPGKPVPMKVEPKPPGSIKVTFSIKAEFIVTVTGPNGYPDEKEGPSPLMFDNVPAGSYSVKWKPKLGTAPAGVTSVVVESGRPARYREIETQIGGSDSVRFFTKPLRNPGLFVSDSPCHYIPTHLRVAV